MDIAGERVGREHPGAGAVGELEGRDAVRRLVRGRRGRGGRRRGRGRGRRRNLASPLGGRGGLLLGGLLLAGLRHHGADPGDGGAGGAWGLGGGGGGDREVRGRRRGTLVLNSDPPLAAGRVLILAPSGDGLAGLCGLSVFVFFPFLFSSAVGRAMLMRLHRCEG